MAKPEKVETVAELKRRIQASAISIAAKYKGINVEQVTALRSKLRSAQIEFKVYKNTLARRALDELGLSDAARFLDGPTAWAFSQNPVEAAKILKEFAREVEFIGMNGGILEGRVVSGEALTALADLPPRLVLVAQVVGTIAAPLRNFVGVLHAVPRNLVSVLDQIRQQKEKAAAA